jgi:hypothetical protein
MRRPLAAALLSGLAVLGAVGTAAATEGPPALEGILSATVFDISGHDGASVDGTATNTTSQEGRNGQDGIGQDGTAHSVAVQNGSMRDDDPPQLLPDPQPEPSASNPQNDEDASSHSQHSSVEGQDAIGAEDGLDGLNSATSGGKP